MEPKVLYAKYLPPRGYTIKEIDFKSADSSSSQPNSGTFQCIITVVHEDGRFTKTFQSILCENKKEAESITYCAIIGYFMSAMKRVTETAELE